MNEYRNYWYLLMGYRQGDKVSDRHTYKLTVRKISLQDAAFETSAKPARDSFYPILTKALKVYGILGLP